MPELDSHHKSSDHPDSLNERFSPWHAAGPPSTYPMYLAGMKRHAHLNLLSATLRLAAGDTDTRSAARQWHEIFGIERGHNETEVQFTNARMMFVPGESEKSEGLTEVTIGVDGKEKTDGILKRALREGVKVDGDCVEMLGVRWRFVSMEGMMSRL